MLPTLPTPPSRDDPTSFSARADAFLAALPAWADAANSLEQSLQQVATTGTSTTSLSIGTGNRTLSTQPGKAWVAGCFVYLVSASSVTNMMMCQVTSYNSTTGSMVVSSKSSSGSGTYASWVIGLSGPLSSSLSLTGDIVSATSIRAGDRAVSGAVNLLAGDSSFSGSVQFTDASDIPVGFIGQASSTLIDMATYAGRYYRFGECPRSLSDATHPDGLVRKSQVDSIVLSALPIGAIIDWPSETPPPGWLENDGSSLLRAGFYAPLYAVLGTAHGAADATHFNLPDHRGKFKRGWAHGTSNDPDRTSRGANAPGGATGDHVGTTQGWQVQSHAHTTPFSVQGGTYAVSSPWYTTATATSSGSTDAYGGNQTNPINAAVMSIIKVA